MDSQAILTRADRLLNAGQAMDALSLLSDAYLANLPPEQRVIGLILQGRALVKTERPHAAVAPLEAALALHPGHPEARFLLAMITFDLGHLSHVLAMMDLNLARHHGLLGRLVRATALIHAAINSGADTARRADEAGRLYQEVAQEAPAWKSAHLGLALALGYQDKKSEEEVISRCRTALGLPENESDPLPTHLPSLKEYTRFYLRTKLWQNNITALPIDFTDSGSQDPHPRHWIMVAAQMKSGSSFLVRLLSDLTGSFGNSVSPHPVHRSGTLNLDLHTLLQHRDQRLVLHQHTLANVMTVQMVQAFDIPVVVMVRNLADALLSLAEYMNRDYRGIDLFGEVGSWAPERHLDAVIDRFGPWMIEHYVSWALATREGRLDAFFLSYETLVADKRSALHHVMDHLGLAAPQTRVDEVLRDVEKDRAATRFNKGQPGRGRTALSPAQWARLQRMVSHYPTHLDYTPLGF